jgi:hypothetical protein
MSIGRHAARPSGGLPRPGTLQSAHAEFLLWVVKLGHSAMSAPVSALPESGHGWTIYDGVDAPPTASMCQSGVLSTTQGRRPCQRLP